MRDAGSSRARLRRQKTAETAYLARVLRCRVAKLAEERTENLMPALVHTWARLHSIVVQNWA